MERPHPCAPPVQAFVVSGLAASSSTCELPNRVAETQCSRTGLIGGDFVNRSKSVPRRNRTNEPDGLSNPKAHNDASLTLVEPENVPGRKEPLWPMFGILIAIVMTLIWTVALAWIGLSLIRLLIG